MPQRKTIRFASCSGTARRFVFRRQRHRRFSKEPARPGKSPQAELIDALINFDKPIVAAVQGAAIGGGTTMLTHCDFVFAGESAKFRMPFVDLAVVPEFGTSYSVPARIGYLRAAELVLLGLPFDAKRAAELGLVTRVVADQQLLPTATAAAQQLAVKPPAALQSCKRLMRSSTRELLERAVKLENQEFAVRVRSAEAKEAFTAFMETEAELRRYLGTKSARGLKRDR